MATTMVTTNSQKMMLLCFSKFVTWAARESNPEFKSKSQE